MSDSHTICLDCGKIRAADSGVFCPRCTGISWASWDALIQDRDALVLYAETRHADFAFLLELHDAQVALHDAEVAARERLAETA